jgi:hypothetical protein
MRDSKKHEERSNDIDIGSVDEQVRRGELLLKQRNEVSYEKRRRKCLMFLRI